jgi:hypothetical protein
MKSRINLNIQNHFTFQQSKNRCKCLFDSFSRFSERYLGCGRDRLSQMVISKKLGFQFIVWNKQFLVHGRLTQNYQRLCETYPPMNEKFHAMAAHYWMVCFILKIKMTRILKK